MSSNWDTQSVSHVVLQSIIACPGCDRSREASMPTMRASIYEYSRCKTLLRPKAGDCCVFYPTAPLSADPRAARRLNLSESVHA